MYIYRAYKANAFDSFAQSCYLPTAKEKVIEDIKKVFHNVRLSINGKSIYLMDSLQHEKKLTIVSPDGDSDTIMYMDADTADEVYRIDKEILK